MKSGSAQKLSCQTVCVALHHMGRLSLMFYFQAPGWGNIAKVTVLEIRTGDCIYFHYSASTSCSQSPFVLPRCMSCLKSVLMSAFALHLAHSHFCTSRTMANPQQLQATSTLNASLFRQQLLQVSKHTVRHQLVPQLTGTGTRCCSNPERQPRASQYDASSRSCKHQPRSNCQATRRRGSSYSSAEYTKH